MLILKIKLQKKNPSHLLMKMRLSIAKRKRAVIIYFLNNPLTETQKFVSEYFEWAYLYILLPQKYWVFWVFWEYSNFILCKETIEDIEDSWNFHDLQIEWDLLKYSTVFWGKKITISSQN